jgi:predicted enzyme related to lactoylglutathione lyase
MHRSKLAGFIIDCNTSDLDAAAEFWSNALGLAVTSGPAQEANYRHLARLPGGLHVEVQQVSHPSRVHLDIEADDIEAEVRRLERLGARRVGPVQTWMVMEAPTGQRFCVVRPQSPRFESEANEWSE